MTSRIRLSETLAGARALLRARPTIILTICVLGNVLRPPTNVAQVPPGYFLYQTTPTYCPVIYNMAAYAGTWENRGHTWNFTWKRTVNNWPASNTAEYTSNYNNTTEFAISVDGPPFYKWMWPKMTMKCNNLEYAPITGTGPHIYGHEEINIRIWAAGVIAPVEDECEGNGGGDEEYETLRAAGKAGLRSTGTVASTCELGGSEIQWWICYYRDWYTIYGVYDHTEWLGCVPDEEYETVRALTSARVPALVSLSAGSVTGGTATLVVLDSLARPNAKFVIIRRGNEPPVIALGPLASPILLEGALASLKHSLRTVGVEPGAEVRMIVTEVGASRKLRPDRATALAQLLSRARAGQDRVIGELGKGRAISIDY